VGKVKSDLKQVPEEWREFLDLAGKEVKWALELGTFRGLGTVGLCKTAKNVITVDVDDRRVKRPRGSTFIKANTHDIFTLNRIKSILGSDKLDILFIDADHTYGGVKNDFEMYTDLVRDGGLVGLHDIVDCPRHRAKGCDVFKFWNEIKDSYEHKELIHDGEWAGIAAIFWSIK
jgi:predicted O-methyltransferase YrrM